MGRVFSYSEIESGKVPTAETFKAAKDAFYEAVEIGSYVGHIDGAMLLGSVALGSHNPRSDFDALISMSDTTPDSYQAARAVSTAVKTKTKGIIPLEIFAYSKSDLSQGKHFYDRFHGQNLIGSDRIIVGRNDPAEYIKFYGLNLSAKDILNSYLQSKKMRLTGAHMSTESTDTNEGGLQRLLELPNAIGRKALQVVAEVKWESAKAPSGSDKQSISQKGHELFSSYGIEEGFDTLLQINSMYNIVLDDAVNERVTRHEYEEVLQYIHSTLPFALKWIEQVQETVIPDLTTRDLPNSP